MEANKTATSKLEALRNEQNAYLLQNGGPLSLREADNEYNDLNRAQIAAFKEQYGTAFLGNINYDGDQRIRVVEGKESIYEEYTGQTVYNFGCVFCVPVADEKLEHLVREWNRPEESNKPHVRIETIMSRVDELQGLHFLWY